MSGVVSKRRKTFPLHEETKAKKFKKSKRPKRSKHPKKERCRCLVSTRPCGAAFGLHHCVCRLPANARFCLSLVHKCVCGVSATNGNLSPREVVEETKNEAKICRSTDRHKCICMQNKKVVAPKFCRADPGKHPCVCSYRRKILEPEACKSKNHKCICSSSGHVVTSRVLLKQDIEEHLLSSVSPFVLDYIYKTRSSTRSIVNVKGKMREHASSRPGQDGVPKVYTHSLTSSHCKLSFFLFYERRHPRKQSTRDNRS